MFKDEVRELPIAVQQEIFSEILKAKYEYKFLENGEFNGKLDDRVNKVPETAFEDIKPNGSFGIFFDTQLTGLSFL